MAENFTFLAHFQAKPGEGPRLQRALLEAVSGSLAEEGNVAYRPYADLQDPDQAVLVERWKDNAALEYHFTTPHFLKMAAVFDEVLVQPFDALMLVESPETPPSP